MRRVALGGVTLIASIAVPATFHGTTFLIVVWLLVGLAGLALIFTSEPVKKPLMAKLRHELQLAQTPPTALTETAPQQTGELRVAVAELCDELEHLKPVLENVENAYFERYEELPTRRYAEQGAVLARFGEMDAHKAVREAYRRVGEVNRSKFRVQDGYEYLEAHHEMDPERAKAAVPAIESALEALSDIRLDD